MQVAGEGAADRLDRVAEGRVDDGVGQVAALAHLQSGLTGRFVQETYQHVGGRRRVEGDAAQPQFTERVGHHVILPPRLLGPPDGSLAGAGRLMVCGGVSVEHRHLSVSGTGSVTWWLVLTGGAHLLLT
ncbi:hypothetical protein [Streptomyces sp. NPDC059744]|uniref:hypothetical protein n=1 Tax=Streptomyces sp. NPDC059744 TaxID=3346929 RepID=UPI003652D3E3